MELAPVERTNDASGSAFARASSPEAVRDLLAEVIQQAHFFVGDGVALEWQFRDAEEVYWEIYQGRLLDSSQTRATRTFTTWSILWHDETGRSAEPILALYLDPVAQQLHVLRGVYCYTWEGYHAGNNIYLSREVCKWVRELVGTLALPDFRDADDLREEISVLLFRAVVGQRLPITSLEVPLPGFSLGKLAYCQDSNKGDAARFGDTDISGVPLLSTETSCVPFICHAMRDLIPLGLHPGLSWLEKAKLLESVLRSIPAEKVSEAAESFVARWCEIGHQPREINKLCRTLFNEVALSPYTDFVDRFLSFLQALVRGDRLAVAQYADLLSYLLRQNARHLTAYDLVTFHHRGANYPDALLLDAVLKADLALVSSQPELFLSTGADDEQSAKAKRVRRRALRQGWLLRCSLAGLLVPAEPTSPGENTRVLPPPHARIPEEEILEPTKRSKRLFADQPRLAAEDLALKTLSASILDLQYSEELLELGMAVFLDRPLGVYKKASEPDRTMLFSFEAFSRSIARQRLLYLGQTLGLIRDPRALEVHLNSLGSLPVGGLPVKAARRTERPGAVRVQDALKAAEDFIVLYSTRQTVREFLAQFGFSELAKRHALEFVDLGRRALILDAASAYQGAETVLALYDSKLRQRLELQIDGSLGYRIRRGQEYPAAGLQVLRLWESSTDGSEVNEHDLRPLGIVIRPRDYSSMTGKQR